jgi:hypothetical protein
MVYLGGPRRRGVTGPKGIYLHDAPPGYHPPRQETPPKDRQRKARQDWILMRATTVVLVLTGVAFMVIIFVLIATHS